MKTVGKNVHFEPTFHCEFGYNISIGDCFYTKIEIGNDGLFGPKVGIYTTSHAIDYKESVNGACHAKKVTTGNHVWIGMN